MNKFPFTIVTVCFNADKTIEDTIKSVLNQTYINYEYIIIDGSSTDNTNIIIKKYIPLFNEKGISIRHISENDNGIYDAMNKGIKISKGEVIYFLNSGDKFFNDNVLLKINNYRDYDILYGNICKNGSVTKYKKINKLFFIREKMICHQSIFANRKTFEKNSFDLRYNVCSDRNWLIKSYKNKANILKVDEAIAIYDTNGYSSGDKIQKQIEEESIAIIERNWGKIGRNLVIIKRLISKILK